MSGTTNYPTSIDDNTTLDENLTDGPTGDDVLAAHQNNQNAAIKALETKVGIDNSEDTDSHEYKIATLISDLDIDEAALSSHTGVVDAHHAKYTDGEAISAMGAKGNSNALNHDRYDNTEAVAAMGSKADSNALNHDRYTDAEAEAVADIQIGIHAADTTTHGATGAVVGTTNTQTLTNKTLTSPDIDGGTIDGTPIGGSTPSTGAFTTISATGNITVGGTVDGVDIAARDGDLTTAEGEIDTLQSDLNADELALANHISDTSAHGTTGDVVGTSDTQTLTNKTLTSPTVENTLTLDSDVTLTRGAANRLDLGSGDSFNIISGELRIANTAAIDASRNGSFADVSVSGDITVSGTVDGVDVAGHVAGTSAHGTSGDVVGTSDEQTLSNKTLTIPILDSYIETVDYDSSSGATHTFDFSTASIHELVLTDNCTISFSNPPMHNRGGSITVILIQDDTGSHTVTWPETVKWPGGTAPTLSTDPDSIDILTFFSIDTGGEYFGFLAGLAMS